MKKFYLTLAFLGLCQMNAQIGIGTTAPAAALDITSTNNGVLVPRIALTSKAASLPVVNPQGGPLAAGTLVWNTATAGTPPNNVVPGFYYWNGTVWIELGVAGNSNAWNLTGNAGTNPTTNYVGTSDAQDLRFRTGAANKFNIGHATNQLSSYTLGTAAAPTYSWNAALTSGVFAPVAGNIGFSTGSSERFRIINGYQVQAMSGGTVGVPFYSFNADPNTGIYSHLADNMGFVTNGAERFRIPNANQVHAMNVGTAALPFYSFSTYTNTGIFSSAANALGFSANGLERMRIHANGQVTVNSATTFTGDQFAVYGNSSALNSYSTGVYGTYTQTTGANGYALYAATNGANSYGSYSVASGLNGIGAFGSSGSATGFGVWGRSLIGQGTGVGGGGNNGTTWYLTSGSGGAFTGSLTGVFGKFTTGGVGSGAVFQDDYGAQWDVGYWDGFSYYKIIGDGAVSTVVDGLNGEKVVMHCTETPENLFEDYGIGKLVNGRAHIEIDPIFAKNIRVDEKSPLKVFVQLEGECNGVYVTNKTANSFDVIELQSGTSNVSFSYSIVATRADETKIANGQVRTAKYGRRFEKAPEFRKSIPMSRPDSVSRL